MDDSLSRVVIKNVSPEIEGGLYDVKRVPGEWLQMEADVFADGYDVITCCLRYRRKGRRRWQEVQMEPMVNDRWEGRFLIEEMAPYEYTIVAWIDRFQTWCSHTGKKFAAGLDIGPELLEGAAIIRKAAARARVKEGEYLEETADAIAGNAPQAERVEKAREVKLAGLMFKLDERMHATQYPRVLGVMVDRIRARFGAWYEMFPRSCSPEPGRHGTFRDCIDVLSYVAGMGFDVVYLPPIHPIGETSRKGPNNSLECRPGDRGSPWAIGSEHGGFKAIHPDLGTFEDFHALLSAARGLGLEIALDIAFQCSPDHPYLREHPDWFKKRPDGSIRFAENPPKKYQDIFPLDLECRDWRALWTELKDVFEFWIDKGVTIFRVDNPHTKSFRFWEWCIRSIRRRHPDAIFLSEAFTRPKVMFHLAKIGFSQSYTYFTWRNEGWELREYLTELAQGPAREFLRPNLFANTPDILHEYLQTGGKPAFAVRLVLAATLGANYGIYGPPFELAVNKPLRAGSEEYLDSEKYQVRYWDRARKDSLRQLITRVNQMRRSHPALQSNDGLTFHNTDNPRLLAYSKRTEDAGDVVLVIANLDPAYRQSGWTDLALDELGAGEEAFSVEDLLGGETYTWKGPRNYVELDPQKQPAHIFLVKSAG